MKGYTVIWTTYVETTDDHVAAAREVAGSYFQPRISAGEPDTLAFSSSPIAAANRSRSTWRNIKF